MAFGDGTVPFRWIDPRNITEKCLVRIQMKTVFYDNNLIQIDPYPAWDNKYQQIAFNTCGEDGKRRVFIANVSQLL